MIIIPGNTNSIIIACFINYYNSFIPATTIITTINLYFKSTINFTTNKNYYYQNFKLQTINSFSTLYEPKD